jgi:hypothetical protein
MEVDLQSLFGLHVMCTAVLNHWRRPRNSPSPPAFGYGGAKLVSKDRQYLFVTPYCTGSGLWWCLEYAAAGAERGHLGGRLQGSSLRHQHRQAGFSTSKGDI